MSDPVLAAIASLSASVASLQAQVGALSSQVATKADATAVSALSSTVTAQGSQVTALVNRVAEANASLDEREQKPSEEQLAAFCLTKQDLAKQFLVVDGITYINEAFLRSSAFDMKLQSRACDASVRPLVELDCATGGISLRSDEPDPSGPRLKITVTASGNCVASGLGIGISQEKINADQSLIRRIQDAAQRGAREGCRMVLNELKRSR
ncbi:hypothetical protein [Pseudomonas sp. TWI929]|uniref:hypothetical protein n=1 Tax=Pseudomonas sp. TWI929 TaxID=3136795 RepID=UPI00320A8A07